MPIYWLHIAYRFKMNITQYRGSTDEWKPIPINHKIFILFNSLAQIK